MQVLSAGADLFLSELRALSRPLSSYLLGARRASLSVERSRLSLAGDLSLLSLSLSLSLSRAFSLSRSLSRCLSASLSLSLSCSLSRSLSRSLSLSFSLSFSGSLSLSFSFSLSLLLPFSFSLCLCFFSFSFPSLLHVLYSLHQVPSFCPSDATSQGRLHFALRQGVCDAALGGKPVL